MPTNSLSSFYRTLLDLLYPPHCFLCEGAIAGTAPVCAPCDRGLPRITGARCEVCSQPFDCTEPGLICPNCLGRNFHFVCCLAPMRARGHVRDLIHRLKYHRAAHLADLAAAWMAEVRHDPRLSGIGLHAIVPVPLHPKRQREREYNQAELLAQSLSPRWQLPVYHALRRVRATETQTRFDRKDRMRNLRNAFEPVNNTPIANQNLILVDDVFTTGSTLDECARTLLDAGARSVWAVTVARA